MSHDDTHQPGEPREPGGTGPDDVGSVGEEAAKLFGALADLARQQGGGLGGLGDGLGDLAGRAAAAAQDIDEHLATGSAECRYCPVCRVVHAVRETSPEVRAHLTTAASSLLQAAIGLLETPPAGEGDRASGRGPAVQRIDLDDLDDLDESGEDDPL